MGNLRLITWARWKASDPFNSEYFTVFTAMVLQPSYEFPIACVAMSIVKGRYRIFFRLGHIDNLYQLFHVPEEYRGRLEEGFGLAEKQAGIIQDHQRKLAQMHNLPPGGMMIRTDTGEIVAEAERIIRGDE